MVGRMGPYSRLLVTDSPPGNVTGCLLSLSLVLTVQFPSKPRPPSAKSFLALRTLRHCYWDHVMSCDLKFCDDALMCVSLSETHKRLSKPSSSH